MVRSNLKEEWMIDWSRNSTGRALYEYMNAPKPKDPINNLARKEQSLIFRLRTGHVPLNNHLHRIKKNHPAQCPLCGSPKETVEHHLLHCENLKDLRRDLLADQLSIRYCLYGDPEQLRATCTYFYQASRPRAVAQRRLV